MLGNRLKSLRSRKNMTQAELAEKIDVARTTYAMYEQNKREPDNETLQRIADYFDVSIDYLLGRTDNKHPGTLYTATLSEKDEKDIAKRLEQIKKDVEHSDGLSFDGEPLSEEAMESFLEAMEYVVRTTKKINKKYTPKKYRKDEQND